MEGRRETANGFGGRYQGGVGNPEGKSITVCRLLFWRNLADVVTVQTHVHLTICCTTIYSIMHDTWHHEHALVPQHANLERLGDMAIPSRLDDRPPSFRKIRRRPSS